MNKALEMTAEALITMIEEFYGGRCKRRATFGHHRYVGTDATVNAGEFVQLLTITSKRKRDYMRIMLFKGSIRHPL
jgi:hypothetical protein